MRHLLIVVSQQISSKIILQIPPDRMNVIGVILRVIVLHEKRRPLNSKIVWLPQIEPTRPCKMNLLVACFATVFISATTPALARDQVPFNGTVSGFVETQEPVNDCIVHAHASNFGNANQVGAFTGSGELYQDFCEDPPNVTYTGTFHWIAANGDELSGTFDGYLSPAGTPGVYDNHETADATGGTGRFTGATGHWEAGGQIDFTFDPLPPGTFLNITKRFVYDGLDRLLPGERHAGCHGRYESRAARGCRQKAR
jgi:hypothetical protein